MIGITGATGKLGRLVIAELLRTIPASQIVAIARDSAKADDLAKQGVAIRHGDYDIPETLSAAVAGVEKLLLISANVVGRRAEQHRRVITAAKAASVGLIAYTSLLHAASSPLALAAEHVATEQMLADAGIPHVLLRNGWYTENYTGTLTNALASGVIIDASGDGRISAAARADYATAAAAVLVARQDQAGRVYELAGDEAFTMAAFAAEVARQSGRPIVFRNLSEVDYKAGLVASSMPEAVAAVFAGTSIGIARDGLFDDSHQLRTLIGRPTTPWQETVTAALKDLG